MFGKQSFCRTECRFTNPAEGFRWLQVVSETESTFSVSCSLFHGECGGVRCHASRTLSGILDYPLLRRTRSYRAMNHPCRRGCNHRPEFAEESVRPAVPKLAPAGVRFGATASRRCFRRLELLEPTHQMSQRGGGLQLTGALGDIIDLAK